MLHQKELCLLINTIQNNMYDLTKMSALPLLNKFVIVIDGMNLFYRFYHIFGGYPYGTAYGFINGLLHFRTQLSSNQFIICWEGTKNWRKDESDVYKQDRDDRFTDEERQAFAQSLIKTKELLRTIGVLQVVKDDCEADDIIAYITLQYDSNVVIVSNDKDFMQIVNDGKQKMVMRPMGKGDYKLYKESDVLEHFKVKAFDIPKLLAIAGDTSDNVKGVYKFGPVKAIQLINNGEITKENIQNVFNKEQLKQFISSYKLVKLGNDKFHDVKMFRDDITFGGEYHDSYVYLETVRNILSEYQIKRITPVECKLLYNDKFIKEFVRKFIQ